MKSYFNLFSLLFIAYSAIGFAEEVTPVLENEWRSLDPNNTVLMTLPHGKVVLELAPQFAPNHVTQFKALIQKGHYTNNKFYRVIEGFVAQAGPADGSEKDRAVSLLSMESEIKSDTLTSFTLVQNNDFFAPQTGFIDGFSSARDPKTNLTWLTHCPGVIAMARTNDPHSGSSHFYIPNGQAPRYLDRIMTIFGRVVYGMENIHRINRTVIIDGEQPIEPKMHTPIVSMQLMSNLPENQKIIVEVANTNSADFKKKLVERKARASEFYYKKPPAILDICQTSVKSRIVSKHVKHNLIESK